MIRLEKRRGELRAAAVAGSPEMAGIPPGFDGGHRQRMEVPRRGGDADVTMPAVKAEPVDLPGAGCSGGGAGAEVVQGGGLASGGAESGGTGDGAAQACGWVRRPRFGSIPDVRVPKPGRVSAYEQTLRNYAEKKSGVVINPAVGTSFDSRAEAYEFYNLYSWEVGFGIRWGKARKNAAKSVTGQEILCSCVGNPDKVNCSTQRAGCKAMIRLHRSSDSGWHIGEFISDHTHPLSGACSDKSDWPSHKHLDPYTKDLVLHLRNNNMDLSKINSIIAGFFGAMENVLFNKRALKSLCARISKENSDDDICKALELFHSFRRDDPSFIYSVEVDIESRIKTLLWTNGCSRMKYAYFGDAITFDTTYRTTLYDMPFGLFVGTNNHYQSVILGGALMRYETEESFKWVFNEFVTLMGGKAPRTILTDQCHEMELAIQEVLPETTHRWCKLHVLRREDECLGPIYLKNSGFKDDFHKAIDAMLLTVAEFESAWKNLLEKYNLHGDAFLSQIYDSRHRWAKPYFKEEFCGKQTGMQKRETVNHILKGYVPPDSSIYMFVQQYNQLQSDLESKESFEESRSNKKSRALSKGVPIEEHAAKVYTRAMFEKFGEIIFESGSYVVDEKEKGKAYVVRHIRSDRRETWSQVEFDVTIRANDGAVVCECGLGEHMGMPCCHAVKVMTHLGMQEIPAGNIMKRWTRSARDISLYHLTGYPVDMTPGMQQAYRYSALYVAAMELVDLGASSDEAFAIATAALAQAKQRLLEARKAKDSARLASQPTHSAAATQGSDGQEVSAVTTDDTTSAVAERGLGKKSAPGRKRKVLQQFPAEEVSQPTLAAPML
ncbi:unnamed protein product [Urochloa decumbens]|uniref:Protein FAR1-RELATED SEQUENCE n=1 Tax=Urochloa decumbens TaxID=240449 RepID=A0ABC9HBE8_9POAL